jgi:hypothetical protein
LSLLFSGHAGDPARDDPPAFVQISLQQREILVIDLSPLGDLEPRGIPLTVIKLSPAFEFAIPGVRSLNQCLPPFSYVSVILPK